MQEGEARRAELAAAEAAKPVAAPAAGNGKGKGKGLAPPAGVAHWHS